MESDLCSQLYSLFMDQWLLLHGNMIDNFLRVIYSIWRKFLNMLHSYNIFQSYFIKTACFFLILSDLSTSHISSQNFLFFLIYMENCLKIRLAVLWRIHIQLATHWCGTPGNNDFILLTPSCLSYVTIVPWHNLSVTEYWCWPRGGYPQCS